MKKQRVLLIAGNATSGKDTFFSCLKKIYGDLHVKRYGFADKVKECLDEPCEELFHKKIADLTPAEKEGFRPVMVAYANLARTINSNVWVDKVSSSILHAASLHEDSPLNVVCDCRFENELNFFLDNPLYDAKLLYITRYDCFGTIIPPANSCEELNNTVLKNRADWHLEWLTAGSHKEFLVKITSEFIEHNKDLRHFILDGMSK